MNELEPIELQTPFGHIRGWRRAARKPDAPKVLALHGWLDNAASFVPLEPHLPDIELVAIDNIGHGLSDHLPLASDYTALTMTRTAIAALDALQWDRARLLGHSLGSVVCSLVAAAAPLRVEKFVAIEALGALTDTAEHTTSRLREAIEMSQRPRRPLRVFESLRPAIAMRMQVNHLSEPVATLLVNRGTTETDGGYTWSSDPRLTHLTAFRLTEDQALDLIRGIDCPTHVVFADPPQSYFPDALRRHRVAQLRQGTLTVTEGTHHLHMEDPQTVADHVREFISK